MLSFLRWSLRARAAIPRRAPPALLRPLGVRMSSGRPRPAMDLSASQTPNPPFPTALIYNQSKHACQSVLADLRAVWGNKVRVIQVLEAEQHALPGIDSAIYIKKKAWGDMPHFAQRLEAWCTLDPTFAEQRKNGEVVFMAGWSAFAESADTARAVAKLGLVWPGTEPNASERLEKIGFKKICMEVGAPTPPFCVLSEEGPSADLTDKQQREEVVKKFLELVERMGTSEPGLIKSIHGGGGKGTAHLTDPSNPVKVREAVEKVLTEMNRSDGIYFENKVNTKGDGRFYQLELEVDGDVVSHGGRFVWFNRRLQKVVEIGLSDAHITKFMPMDLYQQARKWSSQIARKAGNNTRATMEALVFKDEKGKHQIEFIECNRRPQVENEALALLQEDSSGNRRYTFAELMMRAAGHPVPPFQPAQNVQVVLHARWLHGNPDHEGNISYQPGTVLGMLGPRLDWVASELLAPGEISFTADPQLGKAVVVAANWEQMCARAAEYFKLRSPSVKGSASTYAQTMHNLFASPYFRAGTVASNETFHALDIPLYPARALAAVLHDQLAPIMVSGYRNGEGIDAARWPTNEVCDNLAGISAVLRSQAVARPTVFSKYTRGEVTLSTYIDHLRGQLSDQGGAWVTVAPRDTAQQGNDSESAGITSVSRRNAEVWGERAACVGYEIGGAQYQAAMMRGFDPASVLVLGLPFNMPAHSLQRSQYVNGLGELPRSIRVPLFEATADLVRNHYSRQVAGDVPWFPYNFHAGNYFNPKTGYSPQDLTTEELLRAKCTPIPCWVFSAKFSLEHLEKWTGRQIDLFASVDKTLHQVRIKNPGQGVDWTADSVWAHIQVIRKVFKQRGEESPIIYIHNHDFNGLGGHVGRELFLRAQADGYSNLVIDAAYRKNGTHNDNTVLLSALRLTGEQRDALIEYNNLQQRIEQVLTRFDSRNSQMTPWNSDWAGGTEGSDLRIAKEFELEPRQINYAKEVANEVFPLERAVTPFSEYKLRLGLAIMIELAIEPKTAANVRAFISKGGKLKVGGDVLVGLSRWETLVPKPDIVNELLDNMKDELKAALEQGSRLIETVPTYFTTGQKFTALGFQQKGLDFIRSQGEGKDLTPLLTCPQILHRKPRSHLPGTRMTLFLNGERVAMDFLGFGTAPNGDITLGFRHAGEEITVAVPDPLAVNKTVQAKGRRKADPANKFHYGTVVPGELLLYNVTVGEILQKGKPLCVLESMKMEVKISVPDAYHGLKVVALPCRVRTATQQGDILAPGDLLVEMQAAE